MAEQNQYAARSLISDLPPEQGEPMTVEKLRAKLPQTYSSVSDGDLLMAVHRKFYPQTPIHDFLKAFDGVENVQVTIKNPNMQKYWEEQASKPMQGETPADTSKRLYGSLSTPNGGQIMSGIRSGLQGLTYGAGDEIVAGGASLLSGNSYASELQKEQARLQSGRDQYPVTSGVSEVGGALATAGPIISAMPKAATKTGAVLGDIGIGAAFGGVNGLFSSETGQRAAGAGNGALTGAVAGGLTRPVLSAVGGVTGSVRDAVMGALNKGNASRAERAMADLLIKSGKSTDEVIAELNSAKADGQGMFTIADAIGSGGQRTLSGAVRGQAENAQEITDFLLNRQAGQGNRVSSTLADAFGGAVPAVDKEAALVAARKSAADKAFSKARKDAGPVDIRDALSLIESRIGAMRGSGIKGDGIDAVMGALNKGNASRAERAMADLLIKSGKSTDEVIAELNSAKADGQGMFTIADAIGSGGQRTLSGAVRGQAENAQEITDFLLNRQAGQGNRVSSTLADAFGGAVPAVDKEAALVAARKSAADKAFSKARKDAGPVDIRDALSLIESRIGAMRGSGIKGDGIDAKFSEFQRRLSATNPEKSNVGSKSASFGDSGGYTSVELSDFRRVYDIKQEVDDAISSAIKKGKGNQAKELKKLKSSLDKSLEAASPSYRAANDQYRTASRVIDQISAGTKASSGRVRTETVQKQFSGLTDSPKTQTGGNLIVTEITPYGQKDAFRAGYVDPLIAKVENAPLGSNKARPFTSDKFVGDSGAISLDKNLLARKIQRENTMFDTNARVLGGSRTADNQVDIGASNIFASGALQDLMRGRLLSAGGKAIGQVGTVISGKNAQTRNILADALVSHGSAAVPIVKGAAKTAAKSDALKQALIKKILAAEAAGQNIAY